MSEVVAQQAFDPASLAGLPEPVLRYFVHAIVPGTTITPAARLKMTGRIKVGAWLPFRAEEDLDGRSFEWRARVPLRPFTVLSVTDRYRDGNGSTSGLLFDRKRLFHADDENTVRSAAGRAAVESFWWPPSLLPSRNVAWRAEGNDLIVAALALPPERPELRLGIDAAGAVKNASILRWGNAQQKEYGYIPCGGSVEAEATFGGVTVPSRVIVGWWFGTPRYAPFFKATVSDLAPASAR